jgi:hypothetical protein
MADDPSKPVHVPNCSQEKLWALYNENGIEDLLAKCNKTPIVPRRPRKLEDTRHASPTEYEEGIKFIDAATGDSLAVIFRYWDILGNVTSTIRMLRVGNVIYDAACRRTGGTLYDAIIAAIK